MSEVKTHTVLAGNDITAQVETFLGFAQKHPNREIPFERVFLEWARSKDFHPEDFAAIWRSVSAIIYAHGPSADPSDGSQHPDTPKSEVPMSSPLRLLGIRERLTLTQIFTNMNEPNVPELVAEKEYLCLEELCNQIPYRPQTVRNLMSQGVLLEGVHYFKPTSRRVVFKWSAMRRWIECVDRREAIMIPMAREG